MRAFYELYRDTDNQLMITERNDFSYPPHFHGTIEILIVTNGKYKICIDNVDYIAQNNAVVIADSFSIHYVEKMDEEEKTSTLMMIPISYLFDYNTLKDGKALKTNIIERPEAVEDILTLSKLIRKNMGNETVKQRYVNVLLSIILAEVGLVKAPQQSNVTMIKDVLLYIELHFRENITLESISHHFGYSSCHISRLFHSYLKLSISQYINNLRIQWIEMNRGSTDKLLTLIYESGFNSPQTYYRNLKTYNALVDKSVKD